MRMLLPIAALTLAISALPAAAQQARQSLNQQDRSFVDQAATANMAEVQLGKMATQKGQHDAVKSFGQRMVSDHSQANQQLSQIAGRLGASLPSQPTSEQRQTAQRLSKLSGAQFDHAFINTMIDDHKKVIGQFQQEAQQGSNAELSAFAEQTLPTLQQHLSQAETINGTLQGQQSQLPR